MTGPRPRRHKFLADSMVGKLARWLRLLGYDARYERHMGDAELVATAASEERVLLTRDRRLVARRACREFVLLDSDDPHEQLRQLVSALGLALAPEERFRRCLCCNTRLEAVGREEARPAVPPYVYATHRRFARCRGCDRYYWRGTHVSHMREQLRDLLGPAGSPEAPGVRRGHGGAGAAGVSDGRTTGALSLGLAVGMASWALIAVVLIGAVAGPTGPEPRFEQEEDRFAAARKALLDELRREGIEDERVLSALDRVPREKFVADEVQHLAYANQPLPIGYGQTISQPYVVALMSSLLDSRAGDRILEIGTGSGYQAAVLAELGCKVYSIEIVPALGQSASARLTELGFEDVEVRVGDGYLGWPEQAPFDGVIVTAAPEEIPQALVDQLRVGGKMVVPVGPRFGMQYLVLLEKEADGSTRTRRVIPVRFVPMVHQKKSADGQR